ncbi:crotonase/enoyl-CoA hydratase family protein [Candidatus Solirubrobacter pratensis]|uniref:crotonase/enoyl-CoA hydratase family protein n=1 Tax=Candidatus Solirubrobacter pratensis TaxID=1298857 RepID=UPI000407FE84|nr:crotonase/enoyl-CoA hydratase family protein [Candidatus Solirubrobacter pratensis]
MVAGERRGAAALVTIDRPERHNAVDGETAAALLAAFRAFAADDDARVLVLTGAGDAAFCAGADLKAIETLDVDAPGGPLGFTRLASPKPTIAAISGWCLAGGLELALWCDLRIATETAVLGCAERRWGVPLVDGGTQRLPRVIGTGRALELVLTGRDVAAAEALSIGLVNEVVPPGRHVERALELAEAIAAHPQETVRSDRRALLEGEGLTLAEGLALEARLGRDRLADARDGAERFARRPGGATPGR